MVVQQRRLRGDGGLRDAAQAKRLGRQAEGQDESSAVHRAIGAQLAARGQDGGVRGAEEAEVLHRLPCRALAIALFDADRIVELPAAGAASVAVCAGVGRRKLQVRRAALGIRGGRDQLVPQGVGFGRAGDDHLPGLRIAPGRGAARRGDELFDHRIGHRVRQEGAAGMAAVQKVGQRVVIGHCGLLANFARRRSRRWRRRSGPARPPRRSSTWTRGVPPAPDPCAR